MVLEGVGLGCCLHERFDEKFWKTGVFFHNQTGLKFLYTSLVNRILQLTRVLRSRSELSASGLLKMRRSFFRLPVTSVTQYFNRATSATAIVPTSPIPHFSSTAGPPPHIRGMEFDRASTPIDGCDYKHWLVVMDPPISYLLRHQIVEHYIQTLASALGSEEEAKRSIYAVSTKYYYAFGCKIDDNLIHSIKSLPNVRWILPDSHISPGNNDYGGEPFIDGHVVPYNEMFHEDWLQDQRNNGFRRRTRRRSRKKEQ